LFDFCDTGGGVFRDFFSSAIVSPPLVYLNYFQEFFFGGFTGGIGLDRWTGGNPLSSLSGFSGAGGVFCAFFSSAIASLRWIKMIKVCIS
jgi:hypothetical protein